MAGGVDGHFLMEQALQFFTITQPVGEAFCDDGDTVGAAHCFAFEDGAFEDICDALDGGGFAEFLGDEGDGRAGGLSHSHGEEAGVASHGDATYQRPVVLASSMRLATSSLPRCRAVL